VLFGCLRVACVVLLILVVAEAAAVPLFMILRLAPMLLQLPLVEVVTLVAICLDNTCLSIEGVDVVEFEIW
jgi:hypothetical protein